MSLLSLDRLGISLGTPLFSGLDLTLAPGERLGLVAANGRGKSTLLRLVAGLAEPGEGAIRLARGTRVALMLQDPDTELLALTARDAVIGALPADSRDWEGWRADVALDALEVPPAMREAPLGALSGGWQRLVLLARAAVAEPDLLLLDEPTNHLDLARIGLVERWIAALPKDVGVIVASHDRAFLDAVTRRTLFLRAEGSVDFALPFTPARAALAERDEAERRRHQTDLREAAQLRRQAARLNNIAVNSGSDLLTVKTRQLKDRARRIEDAARPAHRELSAGRIRLDESGTGARTLLAFDDVAVEKPDGTRLFRTGRRWIAPGDRVVLLGANGAGKSRLLALMARALAGESVEGLRAGPSIVPGICDQSLSHLAPADTPAGALRARFSLPEDRIRALLAGAGVAPERQSRPLALLSGGGRARLALLILRLQRPNLFLLDEPTNHLDIEGQEALEAELGRAEAAALLVSHDRRFAERVGNRFWRIERGRLSEVDSPDAFFREALAAAGP